MANEKISAMPSITNSGTLQVAVIDPNNLGVNSRTTLPAATPSLTATGITSNAQLGATPLPANGVILYAVFRETVGHSVNIALGSTSGASDIMPVQTVPGGGTLTVAVSGGGFNANWFSAASTQNIYVTSASWGSASINVRLGYVGGP